MSEWPPCRDCHEEPGTCPEGRCRDCDIEHVVDRGRCCSCLRWIIRQEYGGPRDKQHAFGCPLAYSRHYAPSTDAELAELRERLAKR